MKLEELEVELEFGRITNSLQAMVVAELEQMGMHMEMKAEYVYYNTMSNSSSRDESFGTHLSFFVF